jgi:hypothetical protein
MERICRIGDLADCIACRHRRGGLGEATENIREQPIVDVQVKGLAHVGLMSRSKTPVSSKCASNRADRPKVPT